MSISIKSTDLTHFNNLTTFSGKLYIKIEPEVPPDVMGVLYQAIKEIEARTFIRFHMLGNEENGIVVNSQAGCSSVVGQIGGIQSLSLAQYCKDVGVIIHEFMHALGIGHTQSRSDRDQYVFIQNDNIDLNRHSKNFEIYDYQYRKGVC